MRDGLSRRDLLGAGVLGGLALASGCRLLRRGHGPSVIDEILSWHGQRPEAVYGVDNGEGAPARAVPAEDAIAPKPWRDEPPEAPGAQYRAQLAAAKLGGQRVGLTQLRAAVDRGTPVIDAARFARAAREAARLREAAGALTADHGALSRQLVDEFHLDGMQTALVRESPFLAGLIATTGRDRVAWSPDAEAPDYRHLDYDGALPDTFALTPAVLARVAELNAFDVGGERLEQLNDAPAQRHRKLLFGLRGCTVVSQKGGRLLLKESRPDHRGYRCLLGVWDRRDDSIRVFTASTVPNAVYMRECLHEYRHLGQFGAKACNMLATGLYRYRVGPHRKRPGAFRQDAPIGLWRSTDNLVFEVGDCFQVGPEDVCDNIHAGAYKQVAPGWPVFGSAGCQVLSGNYQQASTPYEQFRVAAGLRPRHDPADDGRRYLYLLVTGRDVRLTAHLLAQPAPRVTWAAFERLRVGSTGPRVRAFKARLAQTGCYAGPVDEVLDGPAAEALVRWQRAMAATQYRDIRPDAIAKPRDLLVMALHAAPACAPPMGGVAAP
ncbi:MAG TPA: hypothetical protein VGQ83_00110 [Polyangia bacterium]|jgi:hypothetical protein